MKRQATAVWQGNLKEGNGNLNAPSGIFSETPYSFKTRFEEQPGTNPEELIAAAHAGCFSMALSGQIEKKGIKPENIRTTATITLEKVDGEWTISESHLEGEVSASGISESDFSEAVKAAEQGCPVSRLLKAKVSSDMKLARQAGAQADKKAG